MASETESCPTCFRTFTGTGSPGKLRRHWSRACGRCASDSALGPVNVLPAPPAQVFSIADVQAHIIGRTWVMEFRPALLKRSKTAESAGARTETLSFNDRGLAHWTSMAAGAAAPEEWRDRPVLWKPARSGAELCIHLPKELALLSYTVYLNPVVKDASLMPALTCQWARGLPYGPGELSDRAVMRPKAPDVADVTAMRPLDLDADSCGVEDGHVGFDDVVPPGADVDRPIDEPHASFDGGAAAAYATMPIKGESAGIQSVMATAGFIGIDPMSLRRFVDQCVAFAMPAWSSTRIARAVWALLERPRAEPCISALARSAKGTCITLEDLSAAVHELRKKCLDRGGPRIAIVKEAEFEFVGAHIGLVLSLLSSMGASHAHPEGSVRHSELYSRSLRGHDDVVVLYADDKPFGDSSGRAVDALRIAASCAGIPPSLTTYLETLPDVAFVTVNEKYKQHLRMSDPKEYSVWLSACKIRAIALSQHVVLQCLRSFNERMSVFWPTRSLMVAESDAMLWKSNGEVPTRPFEQRAAYSDPLRSPQGASTEASSPPRCTTLSDESWSDCGSESGGEDPSCLPEALEGLTRLPAAHLHPDGPSGDADVIHGDPSVPVADGFRPLAPRLAQFPRLLPISWSPTPIIIVDRCLRNRLTSEYGCQLCGHPVRVPADSRGPRPSWRRLESPLGALMLLYYESFPPDSLHDAPKAFKRIIYHCLRIAGTMRLKNWVLAVVSACPSCMGLGLDSIIRKAYKADGKIVFPSRLIDVCHLGSHLPVLMRHLLSAEASNFMVAYLAVWQVGNCPNASASRYSICHTLLRRAYQALVARPDSFPELWYGFSVLTADDVADDDLEEGDLRPLLPLGDIYVPPRLPDGSVRVEDPSDESEGPSTSDESDSSESRGSSSACSGADNASSGSEASQSPPKRRRGLCVAADGHVHRQGPVSAGAAASAPLVSLQDFAARLRTDRGFVHIYPSLHSILVHVDSFVKFGVPCALSAATGEHGFMPMVMLMSHVGGWKRSRVQCAFRRAALKALFRILPARVIGGGNVPLWALCPPPVISPVHRRAKGTPDRVRGYRGKGLKAREDPARSLVALCGVSIEGCSRGAGASAVSGGADGAAALSSPGEGTLQSVYWRAGRGGRMRAGWAITCDDGADAAQFGAAMMVCRLSRASRSSAGHVCLTVMPCRRIRAAIELLMASNRLEGDALFQVHCLLSCGARVLLLEDRTPASIQGDEFHALRMAPLPVAGPCSPMFLPWRPLDGHCPHFYVDRPTGDVFDEMRRPVGMPDAGSPAPAAHTMAKIPAFSILARRCLLIQFPACKKAFRGLVDQPVPSLVFERFAESEINIWRLTHGATNDPDFTAGVDGDDDRTWCLVFSPALGHLPIAWAAWHHDGLWALFVAPAERRKGIGSLLLRRVMAEFPDEPLQCQPVPVMQTLAQKNGYVARKATRWLEVSHVRPASPS